ncbi:MAG: hypothetical protein EOP11_02265 [Proteobacteria bacterium]|nr:MAG: hypothetical protein EOP11_02265 [Pseudomonadota bacterium]
MISPGSQNVEQPDIAELRRVKNVGALVSMLADPSWQVRRAVVEALAGLGDAAAPAVFESLASRRDNEARIAAAVDTLVASSAAIGPALASLSEHPDTAVIADAIQIMGRRKMVEFTEALAAFTTHEDDVIAVCAIEALGRIGGRAAIESLIRTVGSGVFFRVFPAIDILGRSGDRRVVAALSKLLADPTYSAEAARALGRTAERAAVKPLLRLALSPADSITRVAILALGELLESYRNKFGAGPSGLEAVLKEEASDELVRRILRAGSTLDTNESLAACQVLGALGRPEAVPFLEQLLSGAPKLAAAASGALKSFNLEAENSILAALKHGDSARRLALLPAVMRAQSASALGPILQDPSPEVRALTLDTLARLGNPAVLPEIFAALEDTHASVSHAATAAAQTLGTREARVMAAAKLKSEKPLVRRSALRILGYFGDDSATEAMLEALQDEDARVRETAIQALPYLEDPRAEAALMVVCESADPRLRAQAMRALSNLTAKDAAGPKLIEGLKDADPWVRYYACQSLGKIVYQAAVPEVAELLGDPAGQVRVAAVEALSHLKGDAARAAMRAAAASEDADVARAALLGLGLLGSLYDLPALEAAANSPDTATRLIALAALNQFSSSAVLPTIAAALSSTEEQVRATGFSLLQARPDPEATSILIRALDGPEEAAARAALLTPSPGRLPGLLAALETCGDDRAHALVGILAKLTGSAPRKALFSAMALHNPAARRAAANLLGLLQDSEAREHLADAAENDPDQGVRAICALALEE